MVANDPGYRVLDGEDRSRLLDPERDFAFEVLMGLSEAPKRLPSRYFYDDAGSEIFQRIMGLDEYYLTRCETEILERHGREIALAVAGRPLNVVDLGAGDGAKTVLLLEHLRAVGADFRYVPIDISEGAMREAVRSVRQRVPGVCVEGVLSEYTDGVRWLGVHHADRRNLVLFLGSNIGNFDRARARGFLRRLWTALRPDDFVLVGFDLKKDIDRLLAAYNDEDGVTAELNLNLLARINRELGGHFDVGRFRHFGTYDVFSGAMASYLVSLERQSVRIDALEATFAFEPWEPVHTEYSYKYLESDVESLARDTGFLIERAYHDERRWFTDSLWSAGKGSTEPV